VSQALLLYEIDWHDWHDWRRTLLQARIRVAKAAPAPRQRVEDIRHRSAELGCLQPTLLGDA
jgi:hypothetical protein